MLAFMVVVLVAVGVVALIARQTTTSAFHRLRQNENGNDSAQLIPRLAAYYAENEGWAGVAVLFETGQRRGLGGTGAASQGSGGPPWRLVDADGQVIVDTTGEQVGQRLSDAELAGGEPIVVGGARVGTLLPGGRGVTSLSQAEQDFLGRVQAALLLGGLAAIGVALLLGSLLFRNITAPLRRLTQATDRVAQGDLAVNVPIKGDDEIGQLGQAFNRMTSDLAQADQLRRNMTAEIAHELRTPLTVIQGNLEAILDGVYPADAEHLAPALRKTQLLKRLVEDLRTLALADAGELKLHPTTLNLGRLVQRAVQDFEVRAKTLDVALASDVPDRPAFVQADAGRIEQVLSILLDNALHHTPERGQIHVALQLINAEVWVCVRDTGKGIPPQALPHVFERFYRASETSSPDGSGLGLSIAQAILHTHGGRIWAKSQPGQGTTMCFALPLAQA